MLCFVNMAIIVNRLDVAMTGYLQNLIFRYVVFTLLVYQMFSRTVVCKFFSIPVIAAIRFIVEDNLFTPIGWCLNQ